MMQKITFQTLSTRLAVCRLPADSPAPAWAWRGAFCSITRTEDELSLVCAEDALPDQVSPDMRAEPGWRALKVAGQLDFALIGILANIASVLASAGISIFSISTYDTDYILVREEKLAAATAALTEAGCQVL